MKCRGPNVARELVPFHVAATDRTAGNSKIQKGDYSISGAFPIIDQGARFISGYTDDASKVYRGDLPVILFGDHTKCFKYVDFPFSLGADGVKILVPSNRFDAKFLYYCLGSARIPDAGYSRHFKFLREVHLPCPPLPEQRRIVDILDRAASIRALRRQAQDTARLIIPALFNKMFGDPATNPMGWPVKELGELLTACDYGTSEKASEDGSGVATIRMGNVTTDGHLRLDSLKYLPGSMTDNAKYELRAGDILFNRTNSKELVGKTGLWSGAMEAVAASYFIRLRVDGQRVKPGYVWAFFNTSFMKSRIFETARGAIGQANINAKELRAFPIPVPTIDLQARFADQIGHILRLREQHATASSMEDRITTAIQARIFD